MALKPDGLQGGGGNAETFKANINVMLLFSATIQLNLADRSFHRNAQEDNFSVRKIHLKEVVLQIFLWFCGSLNYIPV